MPLEELASVKLDDVRMAAIKSLQALAGIMEISDLETYFMPLIANMTMNDKCTKRWSASYLFTSIYMRVSPQFQGNSFSTNKWYDNYLDCNHFQDTYLTTIVFCVLTH